jgi:hypothetical protein
MVHLKHILAGTYHDPSTDRFPPGVTGEAARQEYTSRWDNWEEQLTVEEENVYNESRLYPLRTRYKTTPEQNAFLQTLVQPWP